jgi:hypothetical protein
MKKTILPIDIERPERVLLEDGTMFVRLPTPDELETFWTEHKEQFPFAADGAPDNGKPVFLDHDEWIFGPSKAAVVKAALRWQAYGIACELYNWAQDEPASHAEWFAIRDADRRVDMKDGRWSSDDEARYQADCLRRTPETYRGWWRLTNLPDDYCADEWFAFGTSHPELNDPGMPIAEVEERLQIQTFDDWQTKDVEVRFHEGDSIRRWINVWREDEREAE